MAFPLSFELSPAREESREGRAARRRAPDVTQNAAPVVDALPPSHPDVALIAAIRAGDTSAFESVYVAHAESLYGFAHAYVEPDVAHDVVQDVFFALWQRRATVAIGGGLRAYLFGAVRLRALQYRRNSATVSLLTERIPTHSPVVTLDPAEHAELRHAVARALMTLPGRTRELLALRWVYGMSYTEAAVVLGVSPDAAKKLGRRAEVALAPLLERFRG